MCKRLSLITYKLVSHFDDMLRPPRFIHLGLSDWIAKIEAAADLVDVDFVDFAKGGWSKKARRLWFSSSSARVRTWHLAQQDDSDITFLRDKGNESTYCSRLFWVLATISGSSESPEIANRAASNPDSRWRTLLAILELSNCWPFAVAAKGTKPAPRSTLIGTNYLNWTAGQRRNEKLTNSTYSSNPKVDCTHCSGRSHPLFLFHPGSIAMI